MSGFDVLRHDVEERLNAAVAQGQKDVGKGRDTGAQYIEQARDMVGDALASTQVCIHTSKEGICMTTEININRMHSMVHSRGPSLMLLRLDPCETLP